MFVAKLQKHSFHVSCRAQVVLKVFLPISYCSKEYTLLLFIFVIRINFLVAIQMFYYVQFEIFYQSSALAGISHLHNITNMDRYTNSSSDTWPSKFIRIPYWRIHLCFLSTIVSSITRISIPVIELTTVFNNSFHTTRISVCPLYLGAHKHES